MEKRTFLIKLSSLRELIGTMLLCCIFALMVGHTVNTEWIQLYFPNGTLLIFLASLTVFIFWGNKGQKNFGFVLKNVFPFLIFFIVAFIYALVNGSILEIEKIVYLFLSVVLLYKSNLTCSQLSKLGLLICVSSFYMSRKYRTFEINSLAIIFSFCIIGLINFIDYNLKRNRLIVFILLAIVSMILISLTRMRGAVLAVTIVYTYTIAMEINTNNKRILSFFLVPGILLFTWNRLSSFFETFLFVDKWGGNDFTSGRLSIWNYIIANARIFGNGPNYILGYAHAHNTVIHFIGRYGFIILPLVLICLYRIIKIAVNIPKAEKIKTMYLRLLILWVVFSLTETVDFIKVPLYIPQFMILSLFVILDKKEILYENKK